MKPAAISVRTAAFNLRGINLAMVAVAAGLVAFQTVVSFVVFFPQFSFGFFRNGVMKVFNMFRTSISPSSLFFSLYPVCQANQLGIVGYTLLSLCRRDASGPRLTNPPVLNSMFYVAWSVSTLINVVWNFVFDKAFLPEAWALLVFSILALTSTYSIAAMRFAYFQPSLRQENRLLDLWSLRGLVLNGLAMQITQDIVTLFIESTILASVTFSGQTMMETLSSISLGVMIVFALIFTALDVTMFEPLTRWVISPYLTIGLSVVSMIQGNWDVSKPSSILKACALMACLAGLVTKITVSAYNMRITFNVLSDEKKRIIHHGKGELETKKYFTIKRIDISNNEFQK